MTLSVATLTVAPETLAISRARAVLFSNARHGAVLRRQVNQSVAVASGETQVRTWTLGWANGTRAQKEALRVLHNTTKGGALPIDWTPPDEASPVQVRILSFERVNARRDYGWQMRLVLEEVL